METTARESFHKNFSLGIFRQLLERRSTIWRGRIWSSERIQRHDDNPLERPKQNGLQQYRKGEGCSTIENYQVFPTL